MSKSFPKAVEIATLSLAAVIVGGVWMGSHATEQPSLTLPTVLLIAGAVLLLVAVVMVLRVKDFSWNTFSRVGRWALLAYCVAGGMIEFAFVRNDVRGSTLAVVTGLIVMFALDVPFLIATTVARYQD